MNRPEPRTHPVAARSQRSGVSLSRRLIHQPRRPEFTENVLALTMLGFAVIVLALMVWEYVREAMR